MARPTKSGSDVLFIRDPDLVADLDAWVTKLNKDNAGPQWTRTSLVRAVVKRAVREYGKKGETP